MDIVAFVVACLFLAAASIADLRSREVPDLLSYGLILFGVSYGFGKALLLLSWLPAAQMLLGGGVLGLLAALLFYTGQWGGADAKLLLGLGSLLGLGFGSFEAILFLVVALFAGALYGLLYAGFLAVKEWTRFREGFVATIRSKPISAARRIVVLACFLIIFAVILVPWDLKGLVALLGLLIYAFFYLWLFIRTVEQALLIKEYPVRALTEGDWILHDIVVDGKRICGPKDRGISVEQIAELRRRKVRSVTVKEGIPFVPSFLLGLVTYQLLAAPLATTLTSLFG